MGARWDWVGWFPSPLYIALVRVAYTLNGIYGARRKSVLSDAQISGRF